MNLSPNFTYEEAVISQTAARMNIDNTPSPAVLAAMRNTSYKMETVRAVLGKPIIVTSWYRSAVLNEAVGGVPNSQHILGEAVDFICPGYGTPLKVCQMLSKENYRSLLKFDQLIQEHSWVHISFNSDPKKTSRNEVLTLLTTGGYAVGLTDKNGMMI